ncbi:MAG: LPS assembly protein LptD, partial [Thiohalobacteraceae bacterium]
MIERPLLAALIAGLLLPASAGAQDAPGSAWQCRPDGRGGWQCTPATAGDTAPSATPRGTAQGTAPARTAPVTTTPPAETAPTPATPPVAPIPDSSEPTPPLPQRRAADKTTEPVFGADLHSEERDSPWALCGARSRPDLPAADLRGSELSADHAETEGQVYILAGDAVIDRAGRRVQADRIRYDEALGEVRAEGNVRLDEATLNLTGSSARLLLDSDQGEIQDVRYRVYAQHARGRAETARQESAVRKVFEEATYTTCDEEREAWRLNARNVVLREDEGVGTARHAWLEIADVPVLYTPYMSFPIDDRRKSGLLVPSWGSSQNSGAEFALPYYWNIAPHRDATITPRLLAKRGLQMQGEFRYLNPTNSGALGLEYLPGDREFNDEDRRLVRIDHSGRPFARLSTAVHAADVSDDRYFEDLGTDLEVSSTTHLERLAQATYFGTGWSLTGRVQDFQTVDRTIPSAADAYARLPQLLFHAAPRTRPYGVELDLASELVQFDHDDLVTGTRLDLQPKASLPLGGAAWFLTPAASVRYTQYKLEDQPANQPEDPSRTTPIASLDSGLFFERNLGWFGNDLLQTLEPRAFYLYVPHRDQSDLPVFDTALRDFSFYQMFEDNRFTGADRMGDANQLTLAATTRLLDPGTGTQYASLSLGEIFYFRDREVTLYNNQAAADQSRSNLVAELDLRLSQSWKTVAGV